jgi:sodium-dependent dicarboxylate transporter 2/3/5
LGLLSGDNKSGSWFSRKENIGLIVGPLLFVATILIPVPTSMANAAIENSLPTFAPQLALGTMFWMVVWWVTECVPLGIAGLVAPIVFTLSGILSIDDAVHNFADPIIWIFIAGFILAASFQRWGLDRRIAYSLAMLYRGSNAKIATFFVACLPVFSLTMIGSITASTSIVFPFLVAFMNILNIPIHSTGRGVKNNHTLAPYRSNYAEASFLSLGQAATSGAMLLLMSTAPNLIASATIEKYVTGQILTFDDWFIVGTPPCDNRSFRILDNSFSDYKTRNQAPACYNEPI